MSERLTDAQMAVLRALDALPEGEWATAKKGGFNGRVATSRSKWGAEGIWAKGLAPVISGYDKGLRSRIFTLSPAGRALISKLKAEGKW